MKQEKFQEINEETGEKIAETIKALRNYFKNRPVALKHVANKVSEDDLTSLIVVLEETLKKKRQLIN